MAAVIGVVFAKLFGVELRTFLPYLFMNLTLWGFFLAALEGGAISFLAAEGYIKQIPKVSLFTYPLRMIFAAIVTLVLGLCAAAFVSVLFGGPVGWNWLWALPGLVFWFAFGFAFGSTTFATGGPAACAVAFGSTGGTPGFPGSAIFNVRGYTRRADESDAKSAKCNTTLRRLKLLGL